MERSLVEDYIAQHDIEGVLNDIINEVLKFRPATPFLEISERLKRRVLPEIISVEITVQPSLHEYLYCGTCTSHIHCSFGSFSCQYPIGFTCDEFTNETLSSWSSKMTATLSKLDPTSSKLVDKLISDFCNAESPPIPNFVSMAVSCACLKSHAFWRNSTVYQTIPVAYSTSIRQTTPLVTLFSNDENEDDQDNSSMSDKLKLSNILLYASTSCPSMPKWVYETGYHYTTLYGSFTSLNGSLIYPTSSSLAALVEAIEIRGEKICMEMNISQFADVMATFTLTTSYCKSKSIQMLQVNEVMRKKDTDANGGAGEEVKQDVSAAETTTTSTTGDISQKEIEMAIKDCERESSLMISRPCLMAGGVKTEKTINSAIASSGKVLYLSCVQTVAQLCDEVNKIKETDAVILKDVKETSIGCKQMQMEIDDIIAHLAVGTGVDMYHVGGVFSIECRAKLQELEKIRRSQALST